MSVTNAQLLNAVGIFFTISIISNTVMFLAVMLTLIARADDRKIRHSGRNTQLNQSAKVEGEEGAPSN